MINYHVDMIDIKGKRTILCGIFVQFMEFQPTERCNPIKLLVTTVKVEVKSVLRTYSAHCL